MRRTPRSGAVVVEVPIEFVQRVRADDQINVIIMFLVILGISVPSFVFAALGQLSLVGINEFFGTTILPVAGWGSVFHMLAPSLVLGLGTMAFLTRLMRSSMLEIVTSDFIRTARAKGVGPVRVRLPSQTKYA